MTQEGRRPHDLGGTAGGSCSREEHEIESWEKRTDALAMLLWHKDRSVFSVDELRRHIEDLGSAAYKELGYYERWTHAITQALIQRGVITIEELSRSLEGIKDE